MLSFFKIKDTGLLWALIIGCCLRIIPLVVWPETECVRDECAYLQIAQRIEDGLGMTSSSGWLWAPGYPFLLALHSIFLGAAQYIKGVQIALSLLVAIGLFRLGEKLCSRRAGLLAAWLYVLSPTQIFFSLSLWSETIYGFLLVYSVMVFIALIERPRLARYAFMLGVALGAMALLKGVALGLIPLFLFLYWRLRHRGDRSWRQLSFISFGALLLILPYSIYASLTFDRFIVVDRTMGQMMWLGNNAFEPIDFDLGGPLHRHSYQQHTFLPLPIIASDSKEGIRIQNVQDGDNASLYLPALSVHSYSRLTISYFAQMKDLQPKKNEIHILLGADDEVNAKRLAMAINGESKADVVVYGDGFQTFGAEIVKTGFYASEIETNGVWGIDIQCRWLGPPCDDAYLETGSRSLSMLLGKRHFNSSSGWHLFPDKPAVDDSDTFDARRKKWEVLNEWAMMRDAAGIEGGQQWIIQHPVEFLSRIPLRWSQMLTPHSFLTRHLRMGGWPGLPQWIVEFLVFQTVFWTFLLVIGGFVGLVNRWREAYSQLAFGIVGIHMLAIACFAGLSRYRTPLEPLMFLGLSLWVVQKNKYKTPPFILALSLMVILPLMMWDLPSGWEKWGHWKWGF